VVGERTKDANFGVTVLRAGFCAEGDTEDCELNNMPSCNATVRDRKIGPAYADRVLAMVLPWCLVPLLSSGWLLVGSNRKSDEDIAMRAIV